MIDDLERAARLCEADAELYSAYSLQERRPEAEREAFKRDWQTLMEAARRIRALRGSD